MGCQYRKINIQKRENLLAGKSVWYSDYTRISYDLDEAWNKISSIKWDELSKEDFVKHIARLFPHCGRFINLEKVIQEQLL